MLSAIRDIGELTIHKATKIERPIDGKVLVILLDTEKYIYSGTDIEDFDSEKIKQYLFKEGTSKGNVPSPFCPLTEPQKTYKKIQGWIEQCKDIKDDTFKDYAQLIDGAFGDITSNKNTIIADITLKIKDFPKKTRKFLTVKLNGKYLGEYDVFKKCLAYFEETKRKKSASTGVCSICGLPDKEVSGKTDVFRFYTIDKPGFITGGFKEADAWKNYPVCLECKTSLESGRKFIENNLNFKFYGLNYFMIPRLLMGNQMVLEEIINILSDTTKTVALKKRIKKRITNDENEILEYLSEVKDVLTLNFLFLRREQSAERILLLIEDIFPSRIRKIFDAKDYVDKIFNNDSDKGFTFGTIRTFFSKSDENKKTSDLNKYFLEIVDSVFKSRKLDLSFLVKFYMAVIRKEFISDGYFTFRAKDALMNTAFFENLGLITFEEVEDMEESIFSSIFARYGKSFSTPAKRGVFLLGVLTQLLLNKQWTERNAKPFMKKLKGLKMDEKDIKALLPEVQNKLEEYDSFDKGKRLIASEASKYLLEAGEIWKMSVDEINFYFACGMNLTDSVADIAYLKIKKEE
ncbi:MAG: TIGR02556 family CRISPR-associated protein [Nitrospirota bacterium]